MRWRSERRPQLLDVCRHFARKFDGAYSIVFLDALGNMMVARDPLGIKPLSYAIEGPLFAAASESVALLNVGFAAESIKSVPPGHAVIISDGRSWRSSRSGGVRGCAHCFFEWIYFANVASTLDGRSVYLTRKALGEELARLETVPIDADTVVVPVPDTSKAAADAMAYALKVPCVEGLIRNRYSGRTFIEGGRDRKRKAETKYTPLREVLEGKRVLLVEDSIVRATTLHVLLQRIRAIGAAAGDSRPRGLPAHHFALLLRHRHVDHRRAVRAEVSPGRAAHARGRGRDGRAARRRFAPLFARGRHRPGDQASGRSICAGRASRASIPRPAASGWPAWPPKTIAITSPGERTRR